MEEVELEKMKEALEKLEQENTQLKETLKGYEDAEKQALIGKVISAEKRLSGAAVDEEKRAKELIEKSRYEIKETYLGVLEKISAETEKAVSKVEVKLEDEEKSVKLNSLRKLVGLEEVK